jgi:hypothetical protein
MPCKHNFWPPFSTMAAKRQIIKETAGLIIEHMAHTFEKNYKKGLHWKTHGLVCPTELTIITN